MTSVWACSSGSGYPLQILARASLRAFRCYPSRAPQLPSCNSLAIKPIKALPKLFLITTFGCLLLTNSVIHAQPTKYAGSIAKVDSFLHHTYNDTLPGAAVAIIQNGNVIFKKGYGLSSVASKEKISAVTNFNIASLTKQFTAMAILQLASKCKLSLTDTLSRFFPDMNKRVANAVTIKNLLTHTSGIIDHYNYTNTTGLQHAYNADVYNAIKNVDSLYFVPGTQFRYSNTGFCLLALVIEKLSGTSYNTYMQQHIFNAAGMLHTIVWNENAAITHPAIGYDRDSAQNRFITSGAAEHIFFSTEGDGGIYTSVDDYLLWLNALNSGKVFSKPLVEKARKIEYFIDAKAKLGYGFGWFADESKPITKVYHSGSNGGFRTYSFNIPQQGYSIVVFSNRSDIDVEAITQQIHKLLNPDSPSFTPIEVLTASIRSTINYFSNIDLDMTAVK